MLPGNACNAAYKSLQCDLEKFFSDVKILFQRAEILFQRPENSISAREKTFYVLI